MNTARLRVLSLTISALVYASACGDGPSSTQPIATLQLSQTVVELELHDSIAVTAQAQDAGGSILPVPSLDWSTSDANIARVSQSGVVTGVAAGNATITARTGQVNASVAVTVHGWNIAENVTVIDSTRLVLLSDSAERASGRLRFEVVQGSAPSLATGAIIVGAQGGGFLRRVTSASLNGTELTVETVQAALADAIEEGGFESTINLISAPPGVPGTIAGRRSSQIIWGEGTFTRIARGMTAEAAGFELSGIDVCQILAAAASQGAESCPGGIEEFVIESGRLDFDPGLEFEVAFSAFSLQRFRAVVTGALEFDAALKLEVETQLAFEPEIDLFTFTRPFYFQLGPVPVIGYVELVVSGELSASATAKAEMAAGVAATASVQIGAQWENGWTDVSNSQGSLTPQVPAVGDSAFSAEIELAAKLSIKPRVQVILYGVVGPFAEVEPFAEAKLSFAPPTCTLSAQTGYNAAIGFTIPFLDDDVADFAKTWEPLVNGPSATWGCPLGTIDVGTTTSGQNPDPDGYVVLVDGKTKGTIAATGQLSIPFIQEGTRQVELAGVASNCIVAGGATQSVSVTTGQIQDTDFTVQCSTPGLDLTGNWMLTVDGVCTGLITITQTGQNFTVSGSLGGTFCPFTASGSGTGQLNGNQITFGLAFGGGTGGGGSGSGSVNFTGTVASSGASMSGTYTGDASGNWAAIRQ